jgi:hypothetical protein
MHETSPLNDHREEADADKAREARRTRAMFRTTYEELGKMKRAEQVLGGLSTPMAHAMLEDALWRTDQAAREAAGEEPET